MVTWKFKGCPRCRGDIFIDKNMEKWHEQCLQCGYHHYIPSNADEYQHYEGKKEKVLHEPMSSVEEFSGAFYKILKMGLATEDRKTPLSKSTNSKR